MRGTTPARGIKRRTITTGAAWAAPLTLVSVAAPAYAASACMDGQATLTSGSRPTLLTFPPSPVTATVGWSSTGAAGNDQTPGDTGEVHAVSYSPSWNYLKLHHPEGVTQNDTITLTLTFSQPVFNLSLTITDIDKVTTEWIDEVVVTPAGFTSVKGQNVIGDGTVGSPFTTSVQGGISSARGDVTVTWAGPVSQVQIVYRAADADNDSDIGQHIGVGKIGFTC